MKTITLNGSHQTLFLVFLFFLLVMLSSSGGHLDVTDGKGYFLLTENLVKHHSLLLYPDLIAPDDGQGKFSIWNYFSWLHALRNDGKYLPNGSKLEPTASNAAPLLPLIGVPFYIIAESIHYSTVKFTSYFVNALILALMSTVVFAFGSEFYKSKKIGFALSLIAGIGSFAWPYVSSYFEQPLTALILVSCLYFLYIASKNNGLIINIPRNIVRFSPMLAGLFLGLQSFSHPGTIMIVPGIAIIGAYIFMKDKGKLLQFFAAFILLVGVQMYINEVRFGSITEFGYGYTAAGTLNYAHNFVEGIYGLLVSPGFGLVTYFPLVALLPLSTYYVWRRNKIFCIVFLYVFFSLWVFYGTLQGVYWIGLGGWGPRYMITIIPVLTIMSGSILNAVKSGSNSTSTDVAGTFPASKIRFTRLFNKILKILFTTLAFSGFIINLLGVVVWYQMGFGYGYGYLHVSQLPDQANSYRYFTWYPKYSPVLLHWEILTTDWWKAIRALHPSYFGWAPCIPDNFLYCNFGVIPIILVLISMLLTGYALINMLFKPRLKTQISNILRNKS